MGIRNSAKAIIIEDGKLLAIKKNYGHISFYLLPGGGQEKGETLHDALIRECLEEIGVTVKIGELLFIREYIGKNHENAKYNQNFQQTEFMFLCEISKGEVLNKQGNNPDDAQTGIEWIPLSKMNEYTLYPQKMLPYLIQYLEGKKQPVYLGDIN